MKPRNIRATDAQWSDAKYIGLDRARELWVVDARKKRKAAK